MSPASTEFAETPPPFHPACSLDFLPADQLHSLQSHRLRQTVRHACDHIGLVGRRFEKHGLAPAVIRGIEDLHRLPFTSRDDLRGEYPLGMLAVPPDQVARLHAAPAPGGKPLIVPHTRADLQTWHDVLTRALAGCGVRTGDVVQNVSGYSLFTDPLGLHQAAEALGAMVVPSATTEGARQLAILNDFGVSVVCAAPGYFLHLVEQAERGNVDWSGLPLRLGLLLDEPCNESDRCRIEKAAGIKVYGLFGLPEIVGRGMGVECCWQDGIHLFEDHFYPEVVDPETGAPLPVGQEGELVLTTLTRQAMPLIRYRTGGRALLVPEPCACGRTLRRIRPVPSSRPLAYVVEGVQVLAEQIEAVLSAMEGSLPPYRIVRAAGPDELEVQIEVTPQIFRDQVGAMEGLQNRLAQEIARVAGVRVPVRFVEPHSITRRQAPPGGPAAGPAG